MLLSDNEGYWGESLLTGVEYRYESSAKNPADRIANQPETFGRRLLDGRVAGDWHVPVGQSRGPLVVIFDFKRSCTFTEADTICTRSLLTSLKVEVSEKPDGGWKELYDQPLDAAEEQKLKRARLPEESRGRYMRLSISSAGNTFVDEVMVWGRGEVSENCPENIAPTYRPELPVGTLESIPGIKESRFEVSRFGEWRSAIGAHATAPAIWAQSGAASPTEPILPGSAVINAPLRLLLARNETESAYVTLTNPSATEPLTVNVNGIVLRRAWRLRSEPRVQARLLIGGALPSIPPKQRLTAEQRLRLMVGDEMPAESEPSGAVRILPFFEEGQMLGRSLMQRYLSNGVAIRDYPRLLLPPAGSAVLMLRVTTDHAPPGRYTGTVSATAASGRKASMKLTVDVAEVTLPESDLWIRSWGNGTRQFPFESRSRIGNDARVNRQLGVTVWDGLPTPGSKAEVFGSYGQTYYRVAGIPRDYVHRGFCNQLKPEQLTAEDDARVAQHLKGLVEQAKEQGLGYDDWWVELWDEPQETNTDTFGALARIIRRTDPKVRIYMNPLFWRPGFAPQEVIMERLAPWYNEFVDISVPISGLAGDNLVTRELWSQPRFVRAFYMHPAGREGRSMAWKAFSLGFNGWGYYCYYSPRGNPWDIRTWSELSYSYQMVFPGPDAPIIMPIYEIMRDGWEDYRLLTALRQCGKDALVEELLTAYRQGQPLPELRLKALTAMQ
ncbi:MAG: hypothetical protein HQ546_00005 [Planctomycetes bacterium]|nr:hypothetical protein [Planctomycetota bacterium]